VICPIKIKEIKHFYYILLIKGFTVAVLPFFVGFYYDNHHRLATYNVFMIGGILQLLYAYKTSLTNHFKQSWP